MIIRELLLCNILLGAVFLDVKSSKINNYFIILGLAIGCNYQIMVNGMVGMIKVMLVIVMVMALAYPIYVMKALGAGDVKLFCVIGCFMTTEEVVKVMIVSLLVGAIIGVMIITKHKNWRILWNEIKEKKKVTYTKIHFSIPIFISILLQIGGLY